MSYNLTQTVKSHSNRTFLFPFERSFDGLASRKWMEKNWHLSFYFSALYLVFIFGGQYYMKHRQPFHLRRPLAMWNTMLATFSIMGTWRTAPEFFYTLKEYGFSHSVCSSAHTPYVGFWVWAFVLSKLPELGDTVFVVLRKQPLGFLHWYHHVTVFIFCWYTYQQYFASGRWFVFMNYAVHSVMYCYFALRSLNYKVPRRIAICITVSQISQMIMGLIVSYWAYMTKMGGYECHISRSTARVALGMYLSYFVLFVKFFIEAYLMSRTVRKPMVAKKKD